MSGEDQRLEQLFDVLVYAPLGLALESKDLLPKLAERGRGQVALMRLAHKVTAGQSRQGDVGEQVRTALLDGLATLSGWLGGDSEAAEGATAEADAGDGAGGAGAPGGKPRRHADPVMTGGSLDSEADHRISEPFSGYDDLTAKQIIVAVAGFSDPELREVARYERQHRARSTVLSRVARLLE